MRLSALRSPVAAPPSPAAAWAPCIITNGGWRATGTWAGSRFVDMRWRSSFNCVRDLPASRGFWLALLKGDTRVLVLWTGGEAGNVGRFSPPDRGRVSAKCPADLVRWEDSSLPFPGEELDKGER